MNPVVVGVGQVANKDPDRLVHPVELLDEAARAAFADAGADPRDRIGAVYSAPLSVFSDDDGGAMLAERLGLPPGERHRSRYSGAGPQHHLAHACRAIAAGDLAAALLVGGIADASVRNARRLGVAPPAPPTSVWSQGSDGVQGERIDESRYHRHFSAEQGAGAAMPSSYFAVVESALAAAAGRGFDEHRRWLGRLLAPFTEVAARRPDVAWFPEVRTPEEIAEPGPDNRYIAEPYTKRMCSFPTIDMAAAVLVVSEELADRLGIHAGRRVHPWAAASSREHDAPSTWPQLHRSEAYALAARTACEVAAVTPEDIARFDLYSCFPAAVELGLAAFGLTEADPRPRTATGGLPYFGGPGASYATHAIACTVDAVRAEGGVAAVGALGGFIDDFGVGIYGPEPGSVPFRWEDGLRPFARSVGVTRLADAEAQVVAGTVLHDRGHGPVEAGVIVELPDGTRLGATAHDPELAAEVSGTALVGRTVRVLEKDGKARWVPA